MAHLMLFFELMNVKRQINAESRNQIEISHKVTRMQDQIKKKEKYYNSLFSQLDSQAKSMQNNANMMLQQMTGGFSFNGNDWTGMSGLAQFIPGIINQGYLAKAGDTQYTAYNLTQDEYADMMQAYQTYGRNFAPAGEENPYASKSKDDPDKVKEFFSIQNAAAQMQQSMKMMASQASNLFQQGVSNWLEAQKTALEAEQDEVLDALNYEETELEADKTASEMKIKELEAEKESLKETLDQRIKDDAPSFGL